MFWKVYGNISSATENGHKVCKPKTYINMYISFDWNKLYIQLHASNHNISRKLNLRKMYAICAKKSPLRNLVIPVQKFKEKTVHSVI
jgi:hypothetical protein